MACYAPLLVNVNHRRWNPDLINFDSSRAYGLPGYYVQQLFSQHRGDVTLPVKVDATEVREPEPTGGIGVGTWNTAAEFKDVKVTAPDGKVLFESDFSKDSDGWKRCAATGEWSVEDGALQQTAQREFVRRSPATASWTDYTLEAEGAQDFGREGFLILFHIKGDEDRVWWNIGGWNNTQHAVELSAARRTRKQGARRNRPVVRHQSGSARPEREVLSGREAGARHQKHAGRDAEFVRKRDARRQDGRGDR